MIAEIEDCVAVTRSLRTMPGRWSSDDAKEKAKLKGTSRHKQMTTMLNKLSRAVLAYDSISIGGWTRLAYT